MLSSRPRGRLSSLAPSCQPAQVAGGRLASLFWSNPWLHPSHALARGRQQPFQASCHQPSISSRSSLFGNKSSPAASQVAASASALTTEWHQQACSHPGFGNTSKPCRRARQPWAKRTAAAVDGMLQPGGDGARRKKFAAGPDGEAAAGRVEVPPSLAAASQEETYSLEDTRALVETAMLAAVSGLAFLLSTLLKLDNSLGYFLPLPIVLAGCRSGAGAAWNTMMSTAFLLLVLLGPLRAMTYVLMHGVTAAALGTFWCWQVPWAISIPAGALLRMAGQLAYLLLSSITMNENLFAVVLANVHSLLDRMSAAIGTSGSPSNLMVQCMIFALLLVNAICHVFLLHVVYHIILSSMGYKLGGLPGIIKKYLYAGLPEQPAGAPAAGAAGTSSK